MIKKFFGKSTDFESIVGEPLSKNSAATAKNYIRK